MVEKNKYHLLSLKILPLMMIYKLADLIFFIISFKNPHHHFNITNWVELQTMPTCPPTSVN